MRTFKSALVLVVLALLVTATGKLAFSAPRSGIWYVAPPPAGNDSNDCATPATPCATINAALNKPGFVAGDTVRVAVGTYTGTGSEVVLLNKSATLSGGWDATFTAQTGMSTIDGEGTKLGINVYYSVTLERLTIQNGASFRGAGIYNHGTLTILSSNIRNNAASFSGGGIDSTSSLTILNSAISGNTADWGGGGIIVQDYSSAIIENSTINGNFAGYGGGGLTNYHGTVIMSNSTVSGNRSNFGGGIWNWGTFSMQNSILAGNTWDTGNPNDCAGSSINSSYNLIGNTYGCNLSGSQGDLLNVDPGLGPLQNNGGPTPTQALLIDSPAINAANSAGCMGSAGLLATDQRGFPRVGRCDIGAYEDQSSFSVEKRVDKPIVFAKDSLTYQIILDNLGVNAVSGVLVTDTLPVQLTYINNSLTANGGNYNYNNRVITWNGSVSPNSTVTITFSATVDPASPIGATITNTGTINGGGYIVTRTAISEIQSRFASAGKNANKSTVISGDLLRYIIHFRMNDAASVTGVRVTDTLPTFLSYIPDSLTATSGTASYNNGIITWNGIANAGESVTIAFDATVNSSVPIGTSIVNSAVLTGADETITRTATTNVVSRFASASKTADKSKVYPGESVQYTIRFRLSTATDATTVFMTDTVPNYLTYINNSLTASSGNPSYNNGTILWNGLVNPDQEVTVSFGATTNPTMPGGTVVNSASIDAKGEIATPSANVAFVRDTFLPLITRPPKAIAGWVTHNGSSAGGVPLELRFYNGSAWSTRANATTDSSGYFAFTNQPSLTAGQAYYVRYSNPGNATRLGAWSTRALTSYSGDYVEIGRFDLANIALTWPNNASNVGLPFTFQWNVRPATPSDSYEFNLFDYTDGNPWWWTAPLGYRGDYTLTGFPPGFYPDTEYGWAVGVWSPDGGYGMSYYFRTIRFQSLESALRLDKAPARPRNAFSDLRLPPVRKQP
jgi:uncharacterized repeat protein (TIGR01451 family)